MLLFGHKLFLDKTQNLNVTQTDVYINVSEKFEDQLEFWPIIYL